MLFLTRPWGIVALRPISPRVYFIHLTVIPLSIHGHGSFLSLHTVTWRLCRRLAYFTACCQCELFFVNYKINLRPL